MAISNVGGYPQPDQSGDGTVKQVNTGSKRKRTRKPTPAPTPAPTNEKPTETEVILDAVQSDVARDNVDIRLKAASIESLPDESVLIGGAASMLLMLLDGIGMMAWGDYGKLNPVEHSMIEEPLKRMLAKISPSNLNMIGKYADPVLLMMGLLSWVSRVTMESKRREKANKEPKASEPQPEVLKPETPKAAVVETFTPAEITNNFAAEGNIL